MNFKLLIIICLIVLSFRFYFFYQNRPQYKDGQYLSFTTTLFSEPQITSRYQKISANLASGEKIFITITANPQFHYGDSVRVSGSLRLKVLKNKQIVLTMFFPKTEVIKTEQNSLNFFPKNILAVVSFVRQKIIFLFEKTLSPTSSSLLLGIVFGIKEAMPAGFADNLRLSGVFHVVAASGMNVTIVGGFLSSIFSLFCKRQIAIALSILGILFYAVLAGLEASIIRASMMGILVFSAQILGRQTLAFSGLAWAGFFMLLVDPTLISDIGFQLSFVATLGLILLPKIRALGKIWMIGDDINTTIAAQIATLPILLANFGTYSLWSVAVNGLVLWTVPMLMIIGGLGAIAGMVFFPLGQLIIFLSLPLLLYFEKIVNLFAGIGSVLKAENLPWHIIVGYYGILLSVPLFFNRRNKGD